MTLNQQQARFSLLFAQLIVWANTQHLTVVIDMVARSPQEQARLVQAGASHTLQSKHVARLAGDVLLFHDGIYLTDGSAYRPLGIYWKSLDPHCVWGGDWQSIKDYDHFEYSSEARPATEGGTP